MKTCYAMEGDRLELLLVRDRLDELFAQGTNLGAEGTVGDLDVRLRELVIIKVGTKVKARNIDGEVKKVDGEFKTMDEYDITQGVVGDAVMARYGAAHKGSYYPATLAKINDDSTFDVDFLDNDAQFRTALPADAITGRVDAYLVEYADTGKHTSNHRSIKRRTVVLKDCCDYRRSCCRFPAVAIVDRARGARAAARHCVASKAAHCGCCQAFVRLHRSTVQGEWPGDIRLSAGVRAVWSGAYVRSSEGDRVQLDFGR